MNLEDYFDKPSKIEYRNETMQRSYTLGEQLTEGGYSVAIIGVPADSDKFNAGSCKAPDEIRRHLYALRAIKEVKVADLGNIKTTGNFSDTYFALRDVVAELTEHGITTIVIGGSQNYTAAMFDAVSEEQDETTLTLIDSRIDFEQGEDSAAMQEVNPHDFLRYILKSDKLYDLNILGTQSYFCSDDQLYEIESHGFNNVRLAMLRDNMQDKEPIFRDSDVASFDISVVRHSDAPGQENPASNGLFGEEACNLARYAGLSDRIRCFGLFEVNPYYDNNGHTSNLAAEIIWHFIEAYSYRYSDFPYADLNSYKKIIVPETNGEEGKVFYFNRLNKRMWIEIPTLKGKKIFACSISDYQRVKNGELPNVWLRHFLR